MEIIFCLEYFVHAEMSEVNIIKQCYSRSRSKLFAPDVALASFSVSLALPTSDILVQ